MRKIGLGILLLFLCGCQGQQSNTYTKPLYFVFATPLSSHTLWQQAKEGMEKACEVYSIECDWQGPIRINTSEMENVINTALLKKADGIITQGVVQKSLVEEGMNQDTPIVLVDSFIAGSHPLATIAKDFDEQAALLLADIEKHMDPNEHLSIAIQVSDKTFDLAVGQIESVKKVFQQHPGGFTIKAIGESKSDMAQAKSEWIKVLQKHSDINVALNFSGEGAIGTVDAYAYLHMKDPIQIYGVDDMENTIALIKEGKITGSIVTSFYRYGYDAVKTLYDYVKLKKEPTDRDIAAQIMLVNQTNVKSYKDSLK